MNIISGLTLLDCLVREKDKDAKSVIIVSSVYESLCLLTLVCHWFDNGSKWRFRHPTTHARFIEHVAYKEINLRMPR